MTVSRREFLISTAAAALTRSADASRSLEPASALEREASAERAAEGVLPASVRADFPIASAQTYLNSAAIHPLSVPASRALQGYVDFRLHGPGDGRGDFDSDQQTDLKRRFAQLIGAKGPEEIAFVQNTSDGENIVVMGMDLAKKGGNVVLDELHFETSLYMYKSLEAKGLQLRIVKHRNWSIDI